MKILATLTLTTLTVGMYAGTAAADQATCVVTAQPQNIGAQLLRSLVTA